jgi:tRNA G18 (ribose-2'-O)-methylase SpoU
MRAERVDDPADPRLADYRDLKDGELRRRRGIFIAEGRQVVRRLLAGARFRARSVLVSEAVLGDLGDVVDGVPVYVVPEAAVKAVVGFNFHRGCLAAGERGEALSAEDILGGRLLLVLEHMTNPDNVGGAFRNAMAFGADGVLLSPGCCDPLYRKTIRVSMGGALRVPFAALSDWPAALDRLRDAGFTVIALTPDGGVDIGEIERPLPERIALLLGAEGEGLSAGARAAADLEVAIPMATGNHSLNVAVAAGIALHRFARQGG